MAFQVFPLDTRLAGIAHALSANCVDDFTVVSYKPWQRCVLRVKGDVPQYAKFYRDARGDRLYESMSVLWNEFRTHPHLQVARPTAYVPEWNMLMQEEVDGTPVLDQWIESHDERALRAQVRTIARALVALHRAPLTRAPHRTLLDELGALREDALSIAPVAPELSQRLGAVLNRLDASAAGRDDEPVFTHGAFRHDQLLTADGRVAILDFDTCGVAEPALDVGNFLAYVERLSLQRCMPAAKLTIVRDAFVHGYREHVHLDMQRVAVFKAAALVKIVLRYAFALRWEQVQQMRPLLAAALQRCTHRTDVVYAQA